MTQQHNPYVSPEARQAPAESIQSSRPTNIRWQIVASVALVAAVDAGIIRLYLAGAEPVGTLVNLGWVVYDLVALSVLVGAVRYRGYKPDEESK